MGYCTRLEEVKELAHKVKREVGEEVFAEMEKIAKLQAGFDDKPFLRIDLTEFPKLKKKYTEREP